MGADPVTNLRANLDALPPATRETVESATAVDVVRTDVSGAVMSALLRTPDGRWVRLHSGRAPAAEADQFLEDALPGELPPAVFVVGSGLGYVLEAIARRGADTKVIAIEPFAPVARAMLERRDWQEWIRGGRLRILVGPAYHDAADAWKLLDDRAEAPPPVLEHPLLPREFPADAARARAVAGRIVGGAQANADARKAFAGRYLLNTLTNLPAIMAEGDVDALRDVFRRTPAVVVAAGPSLDDNLNQVRAVADRVLIVSVDTALRPLLAAGIRPHLVVAVDPSEANSRHLVGIEDTQGSWLVSEASIDPSVFPEFAGHAFSFKVSNHHPWPWLGEHGVSRGTLRAWGSVLTTAFDLACHVGGNPIAFVGADLAYTGGLPYCRNTIHETDARRLATGADRVAAFAGALRRETCDEPDVHGTPVVSTPLFLQFRDWLVARSTEVTDRRIVNATGAGILHGGRIIQMDLASLSLPARAGGDSDLRARLAAIWKASSARGALARPRLEHALASAAHDALPWKAWLDFAGDTASSDQITACLDRAWRTPPLITTHPANVFWRPGSPASLTAAATGGPPPTVRWQVGTGGGSSWSDIAGAVATTYGFTMAATDRDKQFRAVFTNTNGSATSRPATIPVAFSSVVHDFNDDGKPDILGHDRLSGSTVISYIEGVTYTGQGVLQAVPDPAWAAVGAGDFNGDGKPEILWRHSESGRNVLWHIDGVAVTGHDELDLEPDVAWAVVGTGDFNGDGKLDILWRNSATGANRVWYMDGATRVGEGVLDTEADLTWTIVGADDFNDDDKPDILWRNLETGANRVWYMDGVTRTGVGVLEAEADLTWTVGGTGDFNGDGKPDILWRHAITGATVVWYMDGVTRVGRAVLNWRRSG